MGSIARSRAKKKPKKLQPYSTLKNKMDRLFSEFVRRRAADENGMVRCVCCRVLKPWKELQCGHFVTRGRLATRWDIENSNPQCGRCNVLLRGNAVGYARFLENRYGPSIFATLEERSRITTKFTRSDLQRMVEELVVKLKGLPCH